MPKLTLEEKRRETLRRQLYGKEVTSDLPALSGKAQVTGKLSESTKSNGTFSTADYSATTPRSELQATNYLTRDLTKIVIFSILALTTQFILFFLLQNHIVKLPF